VVFILIVNIVSRGTPLVIAADIACQFHNRVSQFVNVVLYVMTFLLVDSVGDTRGSLLLVGHVVLGRHVGLLRSWNLFNWLSWCLFLFNRVVIIQHLLGSFSMMRDRCQHLGGSCRTLSNIVSFDLSVIIVVGGLTTVMRSRMWSFTGPRSFVTRKREILGYGSRNGGRGNDRDRSRDRCGSGCWYYNWCRNLCRLWCRCGHWCRCWLNNCLAKSMGKQILLGHNIVLHLACCMVRLLWEVSLARVIVLLFSVLVLNVMRGVMMRVFVVVNTSVFIQVIVIRIAHGVIKVVEITSVILLEVMGSFLPNFAFDIMLFFLILLDLSLLLLAARRFLFRSLTRRLDWGGARFRVLEFSVLTRCRVLEFSVLL
jgi:hypothetical protein